MTLRYSRHDWRRIENKIVDQMSVCVIYKLVNP